MSNTQKPVEWKNTRDPWFQEAAAAARALLDRPAFSYDPGADPLYQAARTQTLQAGQQAMRDTMGRAAGLSGGYASSYAQQLGSQSYDRELSKLSALLPDYYERARKAYDSRTAQLADNLSTALGLFDKNYQTFLDKQAARERYAAALRQEEQQQLSRDQWEQSFGEDRRRWEAEFAREQEKWAAQQAANQQSRAESARERERSYAYRMAMLALQQGIPVEEGLLAAAGIDNNYAEAIRRYFALLHQNP